MGLDPPGPGVGVHCQCGPAVPDALCGGKCLRPQSGDARCPGVLKTPRSFEHVDPYLVGNARRFPASEMSGRAVVLEKVKGIFPELRVDSRRSPERCSSRAQGAGVGRVPVRGGGRLFELLVRKRLKPFPPFFELLYYHIYTDYSDGSDPGRQRHGESPGGRGDRTDGC